jgi:hypothetical protein
MANSDTHVVAAVADVCDRRLCGESGGDVARLAREPVFDQQRRTHTFGPLPESI